MIDKTKKKLMIEVTISVLSIVFFIMIGILISIYVSNVKEDKDMIEQIKQYYLNDEQTKQSTDQSDKYKHDNKGKDFPRRPFFYITVNDGEVVSYKRNMPMDIRAEKVDENLPIDPKMLQDHNRYEIDYLAIYDLVEENGGSGTISYDNMYFLYDNIETAEGITYIFLDTTMTHTFFINVLQMGMLISLLTLLYLVFIVRKILDKALDPLELSIENQKRFTSDASHELRTPLTAMRSNLEVLMNYELTKEEQNEWLSNISYEVERMTRLTNDLLTLSRNDTIEKDYDTFYLSDVFDSISLNYKNICDINISGGDFEVYALREELHQLLMIFIDNGLKYNSKENKEIEISAKEDKNDKYFVLTISDNGDGIDNTRFDDIFERFFREDKARTSTSNGFGLGLSIAKNIINDYNGEIKIESELNEGTTFKLTLLKNAE